MAMKSVLTSLALAACVVHAQGGGGPRSASNLAAALQAKETAFENSKGLFAAHNYAAALTTLEAGNLRTPGSAEWNLETGGGLIRAALNFQQTGDVTTAQAIANLALQQLSGAEGLFGAATPASEKANEKELVGYVYQHLLGEPEVAETYYQAAVNLSPNSGEAPLFLAQLKQAAAETAVKLSRGGH